MAEEIYGPICAACLGRIDRVIPLMGEGKHIGWLVDPCRHVLKPDFSSGEIDLPVQRDARDRQMLTDAERVAAINGLMQVLVRIGCEADTAFTTALAKLSGVDKRVWVEVIK